MVRAPAERRGEVTLFLPTEQAVLAEAVAPHERISAWCDLAGALAGAPGSLASGGPAQPAHALHTAPARVERLGFLIYTLFGAIACRGLSLAAEPPPSGHAAPLAKSRGVVLQLSALFSLDAFGGGFVVQSLLALRLLRRFALHVLTAAALFFAVHLLAAFSQLVSSRLARRPTQAG